MADRDALCRRRTGVERIVWQRLTFRVLVAIRPAHDERSTARMARTSDIAGMWSISASSWAVDSGNSVSNRSARGSVGLLVTVRDCGEITVPPYDKPLAGARGSEACFSRPQLRTAPFAAAKQNDCRLFSGDFETGKGLLCVLALDRPGEPRRKPRMRQFVDGGLDHLR